MPGADKKTIVVAITGGGGQIAYSLLPSLMSGNVFGHDQPIQLNLLDIAPAMTMLNGVKLEVEDLASPLYAGCVCTDDPTVAFADADFVIFLGAFPRSAGMERKDVMEKNVGIFNAQGTALKAAKPTVKCLVIGNPANTNAAILAKAARGAVPARNITALTRLDHNRAKSLAASTVGASVDAVEGVIIWGNHSSTQYPDVRHVTVEDKPILDTSSQAYFEGEFISTIQKRGAAIITARKLSSAASAAKAICDHLRDWVLGTDGKAVSMGVFSSTYGYDETICYSRPCVCVAGEWFVKEGLRVDAFSRNKMDATAAELKDELALAMHLLEPAPYPAMQ